MNRSRLKRKSDYLGAFQVSLFTDRCSYMMLEYTNASARTVHYLILVVCKQDT